MAGTQFECGNASGGSQRQEDHELKVSQGHIATPGLRIMRTDTGLKFIAIKASYDAIRNQDRIGLGQ